MPERVTRAQAEAALMDAIDILKAVAGWGCVATRKDQEPKGQTCGQLGISHPTRACQSCGASWVVPVLRAYLAQRPDEETVRKGHGAASSVFATLEYHAPNEYRSDAWEQDIRAAMYQPEEEA